jgi:hypothetical protein
MTLPSAARLSEATTTTHFYRPRPPAAVPADAVPMRRPPRARRRRDCPAASYVQNKRQPQPSRKRARGSASDSPSSIQEVADTRENLWVVFASGADSCSSNTFIHLFWETPPLPASGRLLGSRKPVKIRSRFIENSHAATGCTLAFVALSAWSCEGEIGAPRGSDPLDERGSAAAAGSQAGAAASPASGVSDVNRVPIHRLNNAEYDNTMHDLLGVTSTPAKSFIADETLFGFDDIASAFGMTDAQYEQYFETADALVEETFASNDLRGRITTCTPSGSDATTCTKTIITAFGLRAWRRPLVAAEVERLSKLATDATAAGEDFEGSIKQVVKAMLSSPAFLYRIESDIDPKSLTPHPVGSYEMASRLSYLLWSSTPDAQLLQAAAKADLLTPDGLSAQAARLLADKRARQFVSSFAGQWLGLRDLQSHQVDPDVFPDFNDTLRTSMVEEGLSYFDEFLTARRSMNEFFTADVNFVDAPLGKLYGFGTSANAARSRVTNTTDTRRGFLGLASFLTMTSFSYRTAPTLRGKWVLENLLCQEIAPPPPNIPKLDSAATDTAALQSENVRKRLEAHRADPTCASCHKILDPIGLGLENYDAIGKYRAKYANGDAIDASGALPDGTPFAGLTQLTEALAHDARLTDCVSEKLLTYALSREVVASDAAYLSQIRSQWAADGMDLLSLVKRIVLSDPFRNRRGEP